MNRALRAFFLNLLGIHKGYMDSLPFLSSCCWHCPGACQCQRAWRLENSEHTGKICEWYRNIAQKSLKKWVHFMTYSPIIGELKIIIPFKPVSWARAVVFLDGPWPHFLWCRPLQWNPTAMVAIIYLRPGWICGFDGRHHNIHNFGFICRLFAVLFGRFGISGLVIVSRLRVYLRFRDCSGATWLVWVSDS
jgi:hypothetical protein